MKACVVIRKYMNLKAKAIPAPVILVVEDDTTGRYVLWQLLQSFDYEAHLVASGEEALAAMGVTKYACVLMDINLPGIDGYETTRKIRKLEAKSKSRTAIVAITGRTDGKDIKAAKDADMDDFLSKPFEADALRTILLRYVYSPRYPNLKVLKPYPQKRRTTGD